MDTTTLLEKRKAKDEFFATDDRSPLDPHQRDSFTGLDYYDPNPELVFTVPVDPADGAEVQIQTSDGAIRSYRRTGTVSIQVHGEDVTLTLYSTGHPGLFIPFRDATSGKSTYGAGRYLDIEPDSDGTVTIDFNEAYNPFCAYSDAYSCPLPPGENWLTVPIDAGEKTFH
jgi:uncharacterized protein (DUF1684 family)